MNLNEPFKILKNLNGCASDYHFIPVHNWHKKVVPLFVKGSSFYEKHCHGVGLDVGLSDVSAYGSK